MFHRDVVNLDVRELPAWERHPRIFEILDGLQPGQALRVVNDQDPRDLYYWVMAERPDRFQWELSHPGPREWVVVMTRLGGELLTVGHSTRSLEELLAILESEGVALLIDVRTVARSRRTPQFNRAELERELPQRGMEYRHCAGLGGLRRGLGATSPNTGWRNRSFRGFADHMLTAEFRLALETLLTAARQRRTAIMCAEAVPWRCHRSLIADATAARGMAVRHLLALEKAQPHRVTPFAEVRGDRIIYSNRQEEKR